MSVYTNREAESGTNFTLICLLIRSRAEVRGGAMGAADGAGGGGGPAGAADGGGVLHGAAQRAHPLQGPQPRQPRGHPQGTSLNRLGSESGFQMLKRVNI